MPYLGNEVAPLVQALEGKELKLDNDGDSSIQASTDDTVVFKTNGSNRWTLNSSGNLFPASTSQGIVLGATSDTSANRIDDYEEGTFNLTMVGGSSSPSSTQTIASEYVKVGKLVSFRSFQTGVNNAGASGHMYFTGIPFTPTGVCIVNVDLNGQATFSEGTPTGYLSGTIIYINQLRSNLGYNTVTHHTAYTSSAEYSFTGHFFTSA